jgi:hypothetical protein
MELSLEDLRSEMREADRFNEEKRNEGMKIYVQQYLRALLG